MVQTSPPEEAIARVSIGKAFRLAHALVLGNLLPLLRAAVLPFALSWAIFYLLVLPTSGRPLLSMASALVALVPYVLFAVSWHRFPVTTRCRLATVRSAAAWPPQQRFWTSDQSPFAAPSGYAKCIINDTGKAWDGNLRLTSFGSTTIL